MSPKLQLDGVAWSAVLANLARALGKEGAPLRLCLIGSAACLFGGMVEFNPPARERATENLVYLDVLET